MKLEKLASIANIVAILPAVYCAWGTYVLLHTPSPAANPTTQTSISPTSGVSRLLISLAVAAAFVIFAALVNALIFWRRRKFNKESTRRQLSSDSKLIIHSADYAPVDGSPKAYDVTECLREMIVGNSLILEVENHNFVIGNINYVPRDPRSGTEKRLRVSYSYDGEAPISTERKEHARFVLPEDSRIGEMERALEIQKQAAKSATDFATRLQGEITQLEARNQQISAQLETLRKNPPVLPKDWSREWKELAKAFQEMIGGSVRADYHDTTAGQGWSICGGGQLGDQRMATLCRVAGNVLIASPTISGSVTDQIRSQSDSAWRWLYFLKQQRRGYESDLVGAYEEMPDGKKRFINAGTLRDLAFHSSNMCLEISGIVG